MTEFRFKPDQMDAGHVHVRVFVGPEGNGALAGWDHRSPQSARRGPDDLRQGRKAPCDRINRNPQSVS